MVESLEIPVAPRRVRSRATRKILARHAPISREITPSKQAPILEEMSLAPGRTLGPYEILAPLGAGGMGEVYEARDTRLGRTVAIKALPEGLAGNPERRARFEREARTVSQHDGRATCLPRSGRRR